MSSSTDCGPCANSSTDCLSCGMPSTLSRAIAPANSQTQNKRGWPLFLVIPVHPPLANHISKDHATLSRRCCKPIPQYGTILRVTPRRSNICKIINYVQMLAWQTTIWMVYIFTLSLLLLNPGRPEIFGNSSPSGS